MKPVLEIFAAMLIHESFKAEMVENIGATLSSKGYTLSSHEREVLDKIVDSFKQDNLDSAINNVRHECPIWPCNDNALEA